METVSCPPLAPSLIEATRSIGYSLETAVADLIDNSVTAGATRIDINYFAVGTPYLAITDNGHGMTDAELRQAMRFGTRNPGETRDENDLGRFGLGLKTASLSQCRRLTVLTKRDGQIAGARWDLDVVAKTNDWTLQILEPHDWDGMEVAERLIELGSGTVVLWEKFDRMGRGQDDLSQAMGTMMDGVRDHLALVFHRYLKGEPPVTPKIRIVMNGLDVAPMDPFLANKSSVVMDDETLVVEGQKVVVRPYLLPYVSRLTAEDVAHLGGSEGLRKHQGFYVYRNRRLLVWGTWFRIVPKGELSKLARVQVDIPNTLDYLWTLDIKKSTANPPVQVRKSLVPLVEKLAEKSKRTWKVRGDKEKNSSVKHVWFRRENNDHSVSYRINTAHPIIEQVQELLPRVLFNRVVALLEMSLPLNLIYLDLTSDTRVDNDEQNASVEQVAAVVEGLIALCATDKEKAELAEKLSTAEPFNHFPDLLDAYKGGRVESV